MTAAQQRRVQRLVHLAAALLLVGYLYAPLEAQLQAVIRLAVLPVLVVTGIAMWQASRIRRLRNTLAHRVHSMRSPSASPSSRSRKG